MAKRILIVDDDPDIRQVLLDRLESYGYAVNTAGNGREALELLKRQRFDGMLLDIHMPEIDGMEVLRRTREDHPALPVVMISASAPQSQAVKARDAGARDYLLKPIYPEALLQVVRRWF